MSDADLHPTPASSDVTLAEAARALSLPPDAVRELVREHLGDALGARAGTTLSPAELNILRLAATLSGHMPRHRIRRAIRNLVEQLGDPSDVDVDADGETVVAREGDARWLPESGQTLLPLHDDDAPRDPAHAPALTPISPISPAQGSGAGDTADAVPGRGLRGARAGEAGPAASRSGAARGAVAPRPPLAKITPLFPDAEREPAGTGVTDRDGTSDQALECFALACEAEADDPRAARRLYLQAIKSDPSLSDAHVNLGRLFHEAGEVREAERHYRFALATTPDDVVAAFNLAVLFQDLGRKKDALAAYIETLEIDPDYADAHYNLARLHEQMGHRRHALKHFQIYRTLVDEVDPADTD